MSIDKTKPIDSESAASSKEIHIVKADASIAEQMSEEQWGVFAERLMEHVYEPIVDCSDETIQKLITLEMPLSGPIGQEHALRGEEYGWNDVRADFVAHYRDLLKSNQLFCAMSEGKVVGVQGFEKIGQKDGRDVYELKHIVALPGFGKGISARLIDAAIEAIGKEHPDAYVLAYTKAEPIMESMKRHGAQPIDSDEYVAIESGSDRGKEFDGSIARRRVKAGLGWEVYVVDLKK